MHGEKTTEEHIYQHMKFQKPEMLGCFVQYCDKEQQPTWINSISSWDTSFLLYFWGNVFIISAVSGGSWCIGQSGVLLPLECCEIEEWDGSPVGLKTSDTEIYKKIREIIQVLWNTILSYVLLNNQVILDKYHNGKWSVL